VTGINKDPLRLCAIALIFPLALSALAGLGKEMNFGGSAFTQGSADFANASPLLVWAPPWAGKRAATFLAVAFEEVVTQ
jgi:hypothetical protein